MARFKDYNYDQTELFAISFDQQILPGTFEYTLHSLIERELDTSIFHHRYQNDATGRPAHDPALSLKNVLLAYSKWRSAVLWRNGSFLTNVKGIPSSRKIEQLCRENIIFMAISANYHPHFTPIADFISNWRLGTVEAVFSNVRWILGLNWFSLNLKKKVNGQLKLMEAIHNHLKLQKYGTIG